MSSLNNDIPNSIPAPVNPTGQPPPSEPLNKQTGKMSGREVTAETGNAGLSNAKPVSLPSIPTTPVSKSSMDKTITQAPLAGTAEKVVQTASQLSRFAEPDDASPDTSFNDVDSAVTANTIPIPKNNPFYGTDLVVFKDNYKGQLPLNGIRESELAETVKLFEKICTGKGKFKIEGESQFINGVRNDIKMLLTRDVGRKLINTLDKRPGLTQLTIAYSKDGDQAVMGTNTAHIFLKPASKGAEKFVYTYGSEKGRYQPAKDPEFIILGHEMTHILHEHRRLADSTGFLPLPDPTLGVGFHNLMEQQVITGLTEPLPGISDGTNKDPSQIADDEFSESDVKIEYQEINENTMRAAFGLHGRVDHGGGNFFQRIVPDEENVSEVTLNYVNGIVDFGSDKYLEDFFKTHPKALNGKTPDGMRFIDSLLISSAREGRLEVAKYLIKLGANPNAQDAYGLTPVMHAMTNGNLRLLKFMIEQGGDILLKDKIGKDALYKACLGADAKTIKMMMETLKEPKKFSEVFVSEYPLLNGAAKFFLNLYMDSNVSDSVKEEMKNALENQGTLLDALLKNPKITDEERQELINQILARL